jgi:hypothetical protein
MFSFPPNSTTRAGCHHPQWFGELDIEKSNGFHPPRTPSGRPFPGRGYSSPKVLIFHYSELADWIQRDFFGSGILPPFRSERSLLRNSSSENAWRSLIASTAAGPKPQPGRMDQNCETRSGDGLVFPCSYRVLRENHGRESSPPRGLWVYHWCNTSDSAARCRRDAARDLFVERIGKA